MKQQRRIVINVMTFTHNRSLMLPFLLLIFSIYAESDYLLELLSSCIL